MNQLLPLVGRRSATAALAVISAVVAVAGGEMAGAVLRGGAVLILLAAGHYAVRRIRIRSPAASTPALTISERCPLGREAGLALVSAGTRRLVVAYAPSGVSVVAELTDTDGTKP